MRDPVVPIAGRSSGFALVSVLLVSVVLMALLWAMFSITNRELTSTRTNADITSGFFAAEAGLNIRGEQIRLEFEGYRRPGGESPAGGTCDGSAIRAAATSLVTRPLSTTVP